MLALLIILVISAVVDIVFLTWILGNMRVMTSITQSAWYNAMYVGIGIAFVLNVGYFIWLIIRQVRSTIFLLLGSVLFLSVIPALIAIVLSFFPASWQSLHFVECVLSFIALPSPIFAILLSFPWLLQKEK
jgi:hypothetical protein